MYYSALQVRAESQKQ